MGEIDFRKRLKGSKLSTIREGKKEAENRTKSYSNKGFVGNHEIEDGDNYFRLMPAHNAQNDPPFQAYKASFLPIESFVYENNEKTDKKEVRLKPIFIATTHALDKEGNLMTRCPIELYINKVYEKVYEETQDDKEREKKLKPLRAVPGGIMPRTVYVYYAWKDGKLARLDLKPSVVNQMEEISLKSSKSGSDIDIFTDIDDGVRLVVTKRGKGLDTKYIASKDEIDNIMELDGDDLLKAKATFREQQKVSDAQLEEFFKVKPLKELLGPGTYKMTDFNYALEGLMRFDEKAGYNIFEDEDYVNQIGEMKEMIPEKKEETEEDNPLAEAGKKDTATKPIKTTEDKDKSEVDENDLSKWNAIKCKKFLNQYILDNYGEDQKLPEKLTLTELRAWTAIAKDGEELPFENVDLPPSESNNTEIEDDKGQETAETDVDNVVDSEDETTSDSIADRLAKLKKK